MLLKKITYTGFIFIIGTCVLSSCKTKKTIATKPALIEKTAFYTIEALRDTVKKITSFTLVKIITSDSKINYNADVAKAKDPFFLKIEITDSRSKTITAYTEHPLFKKFDLYSDNGEIKSKLISLQKGQVIFRIPYFENYKTIKITETINFKTATIETLNHEN